MKTNTVTVWPRIACFLLWTSPLSLVCVAANDCVFPLPTIWLFLLGIGWLIFYLVGAALTSREFSYKTLTVAVLISAAYSLFLINAFYSPDNDIRRDLAEVRIGSTVEEARSRMRPQSRPYNEIPSDGTFDSAFNAHKCDSRRVYWTILYGERKACMVAIGGRDGRVVYRGIDYQYVNLAFP
jgi:hypothetical protein